MTNFRRTIQGRGGRALRRLSTAALASALAAGALTLTGPTVGASVDLAQCNGGDGPGSAIACDVTIINNLNGSSMSSSVTVARHCAGISVNCGETTGTVTNYPSQLINAVHQCNNAGNGGGSTMRCTVQITNNVTTNSAPTAATVNQCNGSGDGLGAPKVTCNPFPANTTGATITQCNGSANGGTLVGLSCTVPGASTTGALPVTVNQCNGSDNGGGSKVTCTVRITNNITALPAPIAPPPPAATATPKPGGPTHNATPRRGGPPATPLVPGTGAGVPVGGMLLALVGVATVVAAGRLSGR